MTHVCPLQTKNRQSRPGDKSTDSVEKTEFISRKGILCQKTKRRFMALPSYEESNETVRLHQHSTEFIFTKEKLSVDALMKKIKPIFYGESCVPRSKKVYIIVTSRLFRRHRLN